MTTRTARRSAARRKVPVARRSGEPEQRSDKMIMDTRQKELLARIYTMILSWDDIEEQGGSGNPFLPLRDEGYQGKGGQ